MANHKSAMKQHRQSLKRRARNRLNAGRLRAAVKRLRAVLTAGEGATAQAQLPATLSVVDRSVKLGVIHPRKAARTKSRLTRALNRLQASAR